MNVAKAESRSRWWSAARRIPVPDIHAPRLKKAPALVARIGAAVAIGLLSAYLTSQFRLDRPGQLLVSDFDPLWASARALLHGQNPYDLLGPDREVFWPWPQYYPLTAIILATPFAWLTPPTASATFSGVSFATLAFALSRDGWFRFWCFLSCAYVIAFWAAQWSPILTAAAVFLALGVVLTAKPTLGAALFMYRPRWSVLIAGTAFLTLTVIAFPWWPRSWYEAIADAPQRNALTFPGGFLMLLAGLKWRRPEGRLLGMLALMPQTWSVYETIPLYLVPRSRFESLVLTFLISTAYAVRRNLPAPLADTQGLERLTESIAQAGPVFLWMVYLPCVTLVLTRANVAEPLYSSAPSAETPLGAAEQ